MMKTRILLDIFFYYGRQIHNIYQILVSVETLRNNKEQQNVKLILNLFMNTWLKR